MQHVLRLRLKHEAIDLKKAEQKGKRSKTHTCHRGCL